MTVTFKKEHISTLLRLLCLLTPYASQIAAMCHVQPAVCTNAVHALGAGGLAGCLYLGVRCELALNLSKLRTQGCELPLPLIRGHNCLKGVPVRLLELC